MSLINPDELTLVSDSGERKVYRLYSVFPLAGFTPLQASGFSQQHLRENLTAVEACFSIFPGFNLKPLALYPK